MSDKVTRNLMSHTINVDLNEVIPIKGSKTNSPYWYINYEDPVSSDVKHHIVYFKRTHSIENYYLGAIDGYPNDWDELVQELNTKGITLENDYNNYFNVKKWVNAEINEIQRWRSSTAMETVRC